MSEKQEYRMGVGASSILMIFVVLCMTTLGVLSYASARADNILTARRKQHVQAYGEAVAQAERYLAEIDEALLSAQADPATYADKVRAMTLEGTELIISDDLLIAMLIPFGNEQVLEVAVQANGPDAAQRFDRVLHVFYSTGAWVPDEGAGVFIPDW